MSQNFDYRQLIDDYLSGNISVQNKAVVEHKIATDPEFRSEFDLQKNVINAIRESRRLELKNRLDNIHVHWYHSIPQSWKIAASVSVATLTTLSAFIYFNPELISGDKLDLASGTPVEITLPDETVPPKPAVSIEKIPEISAEPAEKPVENTIRKPVDTPVDKAGETNATASIQQPADEMEMPETSREADVVVPDMDEEITDAPDLDMDEIAMDNLNKLNPVRKDLYNATEVKTLRHKKYDFHYELNEGTLTLYGNFEDIPYEILEINSSDGKRLFLNYRNSYYMLQNTHEITPLVPVTDSALIKELEIVNDNK